MGTASRRRGCRIAPGARRPLAGCRPARSPWRGPPRSRRSGGGGARSAPWSCPNPAGAITRALPVAWRTAASWSGARSASGGWWPTTESDPASVFQRCTTADPVGQGGRGERAPVDVEGGPVRQLDVGRTRFRDALVAEPSGRLASVPPDRVAARGRRRCSPRPGSGGARGRTRSGDRGRGPAAELVSRSCNSCELTPSSITTGSRVEPGLLEPRHGGAGVGQRLGSDADPGAPGPGLWARPCRATRPRPGRVPAAPAIAIGPSYRGAVSPPAPTTAEAQESSIAGAGPQPAAGFAPRPTAETVDARLFRRCPPPGAAGISRRARGLRTGRAVPRPRSAHRR